jgi:predicted lipase
LAALDIQYNVGKTVRSYTFGSSKVGNKAFAELYNKRVPQTYRFVNRADVVPSLPPLGWYTHVGELHHLLADQVDAEDANLMTDHFPHNYIKSLRS